MNAEFNWWLLIVGLVIGAGLVSLVLADFSRTEAEIVEEELPVEATWISTVLRGEGVQLDPPTAERVLRLHRAYRAAPPPDGVEDEPAAAEERARRPTDRASRVERPATPVEPEPTVVDVVERDQRPARTGRRPSKPVD